jgi:F-type H+-transporting ATPase subunit a
VQPKIHINSRLIRFSLLFILVFISTLSSFSQAEKKEVAEKKYNPTPAILEHIADANDWHVMGHVHIPLPVIIYDFTAKTWEFGMSSNYPVIEEHEVSENQIDPHSSTENTIEGYVMKEGRIVSGEGHHLLDLSITKNVFAMMVSAFLLLFVFLTVAKSCKTNAGKAPKGIQNLMEPIVIFMKDEVVEPNLGKHAHKFLPYLLTLFFFILFNNLMGLIPFFPGGANVTGNIAVTMVLALFTLIIINVNGNKDYWQHVFWMPGVPIPVRMILAPIEIIGVISKPFALMMRLFANITAGHIIVLSLVSLIFVFGNAGESLPMSGAGAAVAVPFTLFISLIELLVAFLQAFLFTMLTSVFLGMAMAEHHHEEAH